MDSIVSHGSATDAESKDASKASSGVGDGLGPGLEVGHAGAAALRDGGVGVHRDGSSRISTSYTPNDSGPAAAALYPLSREGRSSGSQMNQQTQGVCVGTGRRSSVAAATKDWCSLYLHLLTRKCPWDTATS